MPLAIDRQENSQAEQNTCARDSCGHPIIKCSSPRLAKACAARWIMLGLCANFLFGMPNIAGIRNGSAPSRGAGFWQFCQPECRVPSAQFGLGWSTNRPQNGVHVASAFGGAAAGLSP